MVLYGVLSLGIIVIGAMGMSAVDAMKNKEEPTWIIFVFFTSAFALMAALALGDANYRYYLEPYYAISTLKAYVGVDPAKVSGQQLMDAGSITFTKGSRLDISRSMGFRNDGIYCVAPIGPGGQEWSSVNASVVVEPKVTSYDFWAVGKDCCTGGRAEFHCGEFSNKNARGGLRLLGQDEAKGNYMLAVKQAEATHGIFTSYPLFFEWVEDPVAEVNAWKEQGDNDFLVAIIGALVIQVVLVSALTHFYGKLLGEKSLSAGQV